MTTNKLICLCVPTLTTPHQKTIESIANSTELLKLHNYDVEVILEIGCPYIGQARATMLRKALDRKPHQVVFIDHDVSWYPSDLLKLIIAEGEVVAGTYRFKREPEEYMGQLLSKPDGTPDVRKDGAINTFTAPAGFLRITPTAVNIIMKAHPELIYGDLHTPHVDLFNHGAHQGIFWGEDYAFCRRWIEAGQQLWTIPTLQIDHWSGDTCYEGNLDRFLRQQPGGDLSENPKQVNNL